MWYNEKWTGKLAREEVTMRNIMISNEQNDDYVYMN